MDFSIIKTIKYGLLSVRENWIVFISFGTSVVLFSVIFFFVIEPILNASNLLGTFLILISMILFLFLLTAFLYSGILIHNQNQIDKKIIFSIYPYFPEFLILLFGYFTIVFIGFIFLVTPGIFLAVRFSFFSIEALKKKELSLAPFETSWKMTKGYFFDLLFFYLAIFLLNLIGFLIFGVGMILTLPVSLISFLEVYKIILRKKQEKEIEKINLAR